MGNVVAIARKELRSYFASPIAYIVIGLFAVIFGIFFGVILLIEQFRKLRGVPVHTQRQLREVVAADGKAVEALGELFRQDDVGGDLGHDIN